MNDTQKMMRQVVRTMLTSSVVRTIVILMPSYNRFRALRLEFVAAAEEAEIALRWDRRYLARALGKRIKFVVPSPDGSHHNIEDAIVFSGDMGYKKKARKK